MIVWHHKTVRYITCTVCGSDESKELVLQVANPLRYSDYLDLYRCRECGSCFYFPIQIPCKEDYYSQHLLKFVCEMAAGIEWMIAPLIAVQKENSEDTLLDVGCGFGFTLDFAEKILNWKAVGVEPSPFGKAGRSALDVRIYDDYLHNIKDLAGKQFGLVYSSEVVEHVENPEQFVRLLASYVSPNGLLVLTTPNAEFIREETKYPIMMGILAPGDHINLFSASSLERLLRNAGFKHIKTIKNDGQLVLCAANRNLDRDGETARHHYWTYLQHYWRYLEQVRLHRRQRDSIYDGITYCQVRELVNVGNYSRAQNVLDTWQRDLCLKYGEDLFDSGKTASAIASLSTFEDLGDRFPYNIAGIYYYAGILCLHWSKDYSAASQYFGSGYEIGRHLLKLSIEHFAEVGELLWRLRLQKGLSYLYQQQPKHALEIFHDIQKSEGQRREEYGHAEPSLDVVIESIYHEGIALLQEQRYADAVTRFRKVILREREAEMGKLTREAASNLGTALGYTVKTDLALLSEVPYAHRLCVKAIRKVVRPTLSNVNSARLIVSKLGRILYREGVRGIITRLRE